MILGIGTLEIILPLMVLMLIGNNADEDGNGNFYHSVPSGFKMLRSTINFPETSSGITGLTMIKNRSATDGWIWQDSVEELTNMEELHNLLHLILHQLIWCESF